jgi:two-component sensor histidine kinase
MQISTHQVSLNAFFDLSEDLMCICSQAGHFLAISRAWQMHLNWHHDDLQSKSWLDLVQPEDRSIASQVWSQVLAPQSAPAAIITDPCPTLNSSKELAINESVALPSPDSQITNLPVGMLSRNGKYVQVKWRFSIAQDGSVCGIGQLVDRSRSIVPAPHTSNDQLVTEQATSSSDRQLAQPEPADHQLAAELKQKELLLREIHHRVKNNLQVISSLLDLQAQRIKTPEIVAMFQESQHRIRTMALIHERLCQASEFSQINIAQYIQSLIDYLQRSYADQLAQIQIHLHTQPTYLMVDRAIPCGLIVNELITNSFKHAFPQSQPGNITIELEHQPGQVVLGISNDGVPFPSGCQIDDFQTLGLQLVNVLVQQLDGSIELDSSHGTRFTIKFPL